MTSPGIAVSRMEIDILPDRLAAVAERIRGIRDCRRKVGPSGAEARARDQGMQVGKENSRQCLFQTWEALSLILQAQSMGKAV
jgi:hypothetical protein